MIELLYAGNRKMFPGIMISAVSAAANTRRDLSLTLLTMDLRDADPAFFGFQYADFIIDGNDILLLSRTAFSHAHSFHDSNFITFHRIKNFREML